MTNSVIFYCPLCSSTGISWCSWITSTLNFLSLGTYTFLSLSISPFSSLHSLFLSIFTLACYIFSTAFITSLSFAFDFLIFSNKSTSFIITSVTYIALTSNHSLFNNVLFSLSFSTPFYQFGCLLKLPAVTNFIWSYLHQFFDDSHGLKASLKPLRRPFNRYQSHLKVINNG